MIFYIESNLTLLEGKGENAKEDKTPAHFIRLICIVIYDYTGSERAVATFVTGKHLLTAAGFLFDDDYHAEHKDPEGKVFAEKLLIGTKFSDNLLKVEKIYNQKKQNKDDYRKEPAILEVSYCVKGL